MTTGVVRKQHINGPWTEDHERHYQRFMAAFRGIQTHDVVGLMNRVSHGIEWRHCSKAHMGEHYARALCGERVSMSGGREEAQMRGFDLESGRRAALERGLKGKWSGWFEHYTPLKGSDD